jgi:hypothetical protein
MQLTLWEEKSLQPRKRRFRKKDRPRISQTSYSITGGNDCQIIGHTLTAWDLLGCSTCIDCKAHVFCPHCIAKHPTDETAIPVLCERHEESTVHA